MALCQRFCVHLISWKEPLVELSLGNICQHDTHVTLEVSQGAIFRKIDQGHISKFEGLAKPREGQGMLNQSQRLEVCKSWRAAERAEGR